MRHMPILCSTVGWPAFFGDLEMAKKAGVKRLYVVRDDETCRLVNATSASSALRFIVAPKFSVYRAAPGDVASVLTAGGKIEEVPDKFVEPDEEVENDAKGG